MTREKLFYNAFKEYANNLTAKQLNDANKVWNAYARNDLKWLGNCYNKPSDYKVSAYLELEYVARKQYDYCLDSGVIGYNSNHFSWGAIIANMITDKTYGNIYYECFIIYATAWRITKIPIGIIDDIKAFEMSE